MTVPITCKWLTRHGITWPALYASRKQAGGCQTCMERTFLLETAASILFQARIAHLVQTQVYLVV